MTSFFFPSKSAYTLFEYLTSISESAASHEKVLLERFTKNVEYEMSWLAEELWKTSFVKNWSNNWLTTINNRTDDKITVTTIIEELELFVSRAYNVREGGNAIRSEVSTWKYIQTMEMIPMLKSASKYVTA